MRRLSPSSRARESAGALKNALRDADTTRVRETAHKLAGMVGAFSTVAGSVAFALEDRAAQDHLLEAALLVKKLEAMSEEFMQLVSARPIEALRDQTRAAVDASPTASAGK